MPEKVSKLPPLPDEAFDGEKYSVKIENKKCKHKVEIRDGKITCKLCRATWKGPQLDRLYEAFKKAGQTSN